ncbi:MAG: hydroxymethylbilane synthase [Candidatus Hydrogenedentes bacterium]|nr:hydroxymethylbilane synthase [Candidatus Hydrogenedentota bacterium]
MKRLVIGSRGSALALAQSEWIAARLREAAPGLDVVVERVATKGDKITDVPLALVGSKGLFTKELEVALLEKRVDLAVHSLKDVPTELPRGLVIAAVPEREIPFDFLVTKDGRGLDELPEGAVVGTSSLRRQVQLLAKRPDLQMVDIRGNVPTRVERVTDGPLDATIVAAAGLRRLGMEETPGNALPLHVMVPAVSQGALGIEIREEDRELAELLGRLVCQDTLAEVTAERAVLVALGGGCQVPLGVLGRVDGDMLNLTACACSQDGRIVLRETLSGNKAEAEALGRELAQRLVADGADRLIGAVLGESGPELSSLSGVRIVVTRAEGQASDLVRELDRHGADVQQFPTIAIQPVAPEGPLGPMSGYDWVVFTSANAVSHFEAHLVAEGLDWAALRAANVCAIGPATAELLRAQGVLVALTPERFVAESLVEALTGIEGGLAGRRFLLPRGNLARPLLPEALRAAGADVTERIVYETVPVMAAPAAVDELIDYRPNVVTFTSSSTAENFCRILGAEKLQRLKQTALFAAIGPVTAQTMREHGLVVSIEPEAHTIPALVHAIVQHLTAYQGAP